MILCLRTKDTRRFRSDLARAGAAGKKLSFVLILQTRVKRHVKQTDGREIRLMMLLLHILPVF